MKACEWRLFGVKSEAGTAEQRDLSMGGRSVDANGSSLAGARGDEAKTRVAGHTRKRRGRKPLDALLKSERTRPHDGSMLTPKSASSSTSSRSA